MITTIQTFTFLGVLTAMLVGLVGLIIPVYPGLLIIWLAALVYGIVHGFSTLGFILLGVMTVLLVGGEIVDNLMMAAGARGSGVPWRTILLAMLAALLLTFLHPLAGLVGAPLTLFLLEWKRLHDRTKALQAVRGLLIGWGLGFATRFGIGLVMILLWGIWVWKG